jgi:hypothetical protein
MKYADLRPYADPENVGRKLLEIANTVEAIQDGRIHIKNITGRSCSRKAAARRNMGWPSACDRARLAVEARVRDRRTV